MSKDGLKRPTVKDGATAVNDPSGEHKRPVVVVGIGTSTAGFDSTQQLFGSMAPGHRVGFVLIQHLDPSQQHLTVKQLQTNTALAVVEATDGMPVLADRIHVMPPDKFLNITG